MPARKPYKVDIDVVPYLSIMAIVLKLICLILIVMVMRIAINPDALRVIRYAQLYQPPEEANVKDAGGGTKKQISAEPVYIDCHPDHIEVQPEGKIIAISELQERNGVFQQVLGRLEVNQSNEFAIVIARPLSAPVYRFVRRQIMQRKLTVGYDVLERDVTIDWQRAVTSLQVKLEELEKEKRKREEKKRAAARGAAAPSSESASPDEPVRK